jgi:hypothetical protein
VTQRAPEDRDAKKKMKWQNFAITLTADEPKACASSDCKIAPPCHTGTIARIALGSRTRSSPSKRYFIPRSLREPDRLWMSSSHKPTTVQTIRNSLGISTSKMAVNCLNCP